MSCKTSVKSSSERYLQAIKGCEFVHYNVYTPDVQGEIDVVGINMREKTIYVCEVAVHLVTGLLYVGRDGQPENVARFLRKFAKDIDYANNHFADYTKVYMLWSPIVKSSRAGARHNQIRDIQEIKEFLARERNVDLQLVVNEHFKACIDELKAFAARETKDLKSPVLRLLQIDAKLTKHLATISARQNRLSEKLRVDDARTDGDL